MAVSLEAEVVDLLLLKPDRNGHRLVLSLRLQIEALCQGHSSGCTPHSLTSGEDEAGGSVPPKVASKIINTGTH